MGELRLEPKAPRQLKKLVKELLSEFRKIRRDTKNRRMDSYVYKRDVYRYNAYLLTVNSITDNSFEEINISKMGFDSRISISEYFSRVDRIVQSLEELFEQIK